MQRSRSDIHTWISVNSQVLDMEINKTFELSLCCLQNKTTFFFNQKKNICFMILFSKYDVWMDVHICRNAYQWMPKVNECHSSESVLLDFSWCCLVSWIRDKASCWHLELSDNVCGAGQQAQGSFSLGLS